MELFEIAMDEKDWNACNLTPEMTRTNVVMMTIRLSQTKTSTKLFGIAVDETKIYTNWELTCAS